MIAALVIPHLFALVGLGLLVFSFFSYRRTRRFLAQAVRTRGTVVDLVKTRSSNTSNTSGSSHTSGSSGASRTPLVTYYSPMVEFRDRHGEIIRFTSGVGSSPPGYARGDTVDVLYDPPRPQEASVNAFFPPWGWSIISGGLGAAFFLFGAAFILGHA